MMTMEVLFLCTNIHLTLYLSLNLLVCPFFSSLLHCNMKHEPIQTLHTEIRQVVDNTGRPLWWLKI